MDDTTKNRIVILLHNGLYKAFWRYPTLDPEDHDELVFIANDPECAIIRAEDFQRGKGRFRKQGPHRMVEEVVWL